MTDKIQKTIATRTKQLGYSGYRVWQLVQDRFSETGKAPSEETIQRYLAGRCALNSRYVSMICEVVGLELKVRK